MDDTLILHIENGKNYKITIYGNFLKSCYGNSLERLVCYYEPIRKVSQEKLQLVQSGLAPKLKIPKELWRMVDYLYKYGLRDGRNLYWELIIIGGLFQETGDVYEAREVRDRIDNGKSLADFRGSIHR